MSAQHSTECRQSRAYLNSLYHSVLQKYKDKGKIFPPTKIAQHLIITFRQIKIGIIADAVANALIIAVATAQVLRDGGIITVVIVTLRYGVRSIGKAEPDLCSLQTVRSAVSPTGSLESLHTLHE